MNSSRLFISLIAGTFFAAVVTIFLFPAKTSAQKIETRGAAQVQSTNAEKPGAQRAVEAAEEENEMNRGFLKRRSWPEERIPVEAFRLAADEASKMPMLQAPKGKNGKLAEMKWEQIGPYGISGRVSAIAMHPTDSATFYAGAAAGGVWKTTDYGTSWLSLTDTFTTMASGALAIDQQNPETIYWGQGESNYSADCFPGSGLFRSTNGGDSWAYLGLAATQYISKIIIDPADSKRIYVAAPGPNFLSDSNRGVFVTTDGGTTWSRSLGVRLGTAKFSPWLSIIDLVMNPRDNKQLVAAAWDHTGEQGLVGPNTGLWYTSDGGAGWTRIDTLQHGYPSGAQFRYLSRGAVHWAADANGSYLYAAATVSDTNAITHRRSDVNFFGLYGTSDPMGQWTMLQNPALRIPYGGNNVDSADILYRQGSYNLYLGGAEDDPNDLYLGGIDVFHSANGGKNFTNITKSYPAYFANDRSQHSDQHGMAMGPALGGRDLFVISDGGVFHYNSHDSWTQLKGLPITMIYSIDTWNAGMKDQVISSAQDIRIVGGTQDNGTVAKGFGEYPDWKWINRGDGGVPITHPTDKNTLITSLQLGKIFQRSTLDSLRPNIGGDLAVNDPTPQAYRWQVITQPLLFGGSKLTDTAESVSFIPPIVLDNGTSLYTGRSHIYKADLDLTIPMNVKWSRWSPAIMGDTGNTKNWSFATESIGLGKRDALGRPMVWATGMYQAKTLTGLHFYPSVWQSVEDDARPRGMAPAWRNVNRGLPTAIISSVAPDTLDASVAFATIGRYQSGKSVYRTTNGGVSWQSITGNLPSAPVNKILIDRAAELGDPLRRNQALIIATDFGVYATTNGGIAWGVLGEGLPSIVVNDIHIYKNWLIAATHGRSAWAVDISSLVAEPKSSIRTAASERPDALSAYPNPLLLSRSHIVDLYISESIGTGSSVRLIETAMGKLVFAVPLAAQSAGSKTSISLPELPSGAYELQLISTSGELLGRQSMRLLR